MEYWIFLPILVMSIVIHEVAHAWQARREGDYTADQLGRITLNPIPHLDPIGSVVLPLILILSQASFFFGWAKPVPVNPANFRSPRAGDIRVSMAGIVSNLGLAALFTLIGAAIATVGAPEAAWIFDALRICLLAISVNLVLAFFNLIPIPPLDGSHVVAQLLPPRLSHAYQRAGRYGFLVIVALVFVPQLRPVLGALLAPVLFLQGAAQDWFLTLWT
jgi:Zn-dependent protease